MTLKALVRVGDEITVEVNDDAILDHVMENMALREAILDECCDCTDAVDEALEEQYPDDAERIVANVESLMERSLPHERESLVARVLDIACRYAAVKDHRP